MSADPKRVQALARWFARSALGVTLASCSRSPSPIDAPRAGVPGETRSIAVPNSVAVAVASSASNPPDPSPLDPPGVYLGRTLAQPMSYLGAGWLDRTNRDEVQKPEHVLDVLGVHAGETVADVGCGSGYFTVHLAKRVGPQGRVFAVDLQKEMLDLLAKKLSAEKLGNVTALHATESDVRLTERSLDLALLVDVYHELPNPPATLAQIKRALLPNGRLALVEYRAEDPQVAIKPEHKMTLDQLRRELSANGWWFVESDESLPEQRIVVFRP